MVGSFWHRLGLKAIAVAGALALLTFSVPTMGDELPGEGVEVQPVNQGYSNEFFQERIVIIGLKKLGYDVKTPLEASVPTGHLAVGQGDAEFYASHWDPLHHHFFEKAGGQETATKVGVLVEGALQGYLIDKETAKDHGIETLDQLKDPEIAKLFDNDGDGTADLTGCDPGWGCERVIEHHLDAYDLRDTVTHNQGRYMALIADTITRYNQGESIFYFTWTPLWVSEVLVPSKDVVWLTVPFTSLPDERTEDTTVPNLGNLGFAINDIRVVANKEFLSANPAAKRWFELVTVPLDDVNAQSLKMRKGEDSVSDIHRHAEEWVAANQEKFDRWIEEAKEATNM